VQVRLGVRRMHDELKELVAVLEDLATRISAQTVGVDHEILASDLARGSIEADVSDYIVVEPCLGLVGMVEVSHPVTHEFGSLRVRKSSPYCFVDERVLIGFCCLLAEAGSLGGVFFWRETVDWDLEDLFAEYRYPPSASACSLRPAKRSGSAALQSAVEQRRLQHVVSLCLRLHHA